MSLGVSQELVDRCDRRPLTARRAARGNTRVSDGDTCCSRGDGRQASSHARQPRHQRFTFAVDHSLSFKAGDPAPHRSAHVTRQGPRASTALDPRLPMAENALPERRDTRQQSRPSRLGQVAACPYPSPARAPPHLGDQSPFCLLSYHGGALSGGVSCTHLRCVGHCDAPISQLYPRLGRFRAGRVNGDHQLQEYEAASPELAKVDTEQSTPERLDRQLRLMAAWISGRRTRGVLRTCRGCWRRGRTGSPGRHDDCADERRRSVGSAR